MYRFPTDLDLSPALGQETTQLHVGLYDLQFSLGPVTFAIQSRVELWHNRELVGSWEAGGWPDPTFRQMFNTPVLAISVPDETRLSIQFANGLELQLLDTSDQYESMQIYVDGRDGVDII